MGMVVRTNTMAMNANRQLSVNNNSVGKSLEKLSSGFRINRAADDASGLAISEKMKAQIKGLEQASANSQDGISLIQTAEGATQEIHNMLNRMVELATKSANGTIKNEVDRDAIQQEVNDLNSEISRIAESTNFNGIKLLNGELGAAAKVKTTAGADAVTTGASPAVKTSFEVNIDSLLAAGIADTEEFKIGDKTITGATATTSTKADALNVISTAINGQDVVIDSKTYVATMTGSKISFTEKDDPTADYTPAAGTIAGAITNNAAPLADTEVTAIVAGKKENLGTTVAATGATTELDFTGKTGADVIGNTLTIEGKTYEFVKTGETAADGNSAIFIADDANATAIASALNTGLTADLAAAGTATSAAAAGKVTITSAATGVDAAAIDVTQGGGGLTLQVGDTNDSFNHVSVSVADLSATGLGINGLKVSTEKDAGNSIDTIKKAINTVSTNRANLGSLQNRLEYTINNLDTTAENMTAANSRIRDTDMAKEMMNYTKMNILTQSAQAMLAQANQQPQAILQLLQ